MIVKLSVIKVIGQEQAWLWADLAIKIEMQSPLARFFSIDSSCSKVLELGYTRTPARSAVLIVEISTISGSIQIMSQSLAKLINSSAVWALLENLMPIPSLLASDW